MVVALAKAFGFLDSHKSFFRLDQGFFGATFLCSCLPQISLHAKAELLQEGIFFFIHLFARDVLVKERVGN